jgi:hypothetical protein
MLYIISILAAIAGSLGFYWSTTRKMLRQTQTIRKDLQRLSEAVSQLAEIQMKAHQKSAVRMGEMEQRMMELSVPSHDDSLPLERRHQVLALARQGVALGDIVKRLKAPVGEAELILNLSKYMGNESSPAHKTRGQVKQYA